MREKIGHLSNPKLFFEMLLINFLHRILTDTLKWATIFLYITKLIDRMKNTQRIKMPSTKSDFQQLRQQTAEPEQQEPH